MYVKNLQFLKDKFLYKCVFFVLCVFSRKIMIVKFLFYLVVELLGVFIYISFLKLKKVYYVIIKNIVFKIYGGIVFMVS